MIAFVSILMIVMVFLKCVISLVTTKIVGNFVERCNRTVTMEVVRHFINRDYYWHMTQKSQDAILRIFDRYYLVLMLAHILNLYGNVLVCLVLFLSLSILEPQLTAIVVVVFGFAGIMLYGSIRLKLDRAGKAVFEADLETKKVLVALQKAMREVVIHRQQSLSLKHFEAILTRTLRPRSFIFFAAYIPSQILELVGFVTIGALVVIMLHSKLPMEQIVTTASLLMLTAWRILPAVNRCLSSSVQIRGFRPNAMVFLDLLEEFKDDKGKKLPEPEPGFKFTSDLTLKNACFTYPEGDRPALEGVDLVIKKGETVGIIGPSGSGKSTLALLLTGLVPPSSGEFLVDGRALSPQLREAYFKLLGYVPQTPLILDGTIADNIAFRDWGKSYEPERLKRAASLSALDFIDELPLGFKTELSSSSQSLSGGQIQRIAIARALYNDPGVLIFDEATSSLDLNSENTIRRSVQEIKDRTTSIIIAHRLSTVEGCDRLVWLEDGRLRRTGPPSELLPLYTEDVLKREQN
jgi:ABC-type bacteriocin/lantibiotic exporter with double-glycine peptidase domain